LFQIVEDKFIFEVNDVFEALHLGSGKKHKKKLLYIHLYNSSNKKIIDF